MGIELDVLVGHPEHELLFVATQVARAAGLKNPSAVVSNHKRDFNAPSVTFKAIKETYSFAVGLPSGPDGKSYHPATNLMPEPALYAMLLRGHAPASEPFRKWVTEEVLPTIRKTGSYNAADSENPIAQGIMDRLMSLEGIVLKQNAMLEQMQEAMCKFAHRELAPEADTAPSPYEGQSMVALHDPAGFNEKTYRELAEYLSRSAVDRLEPRVELHI